ncbi:MAG: tetratricopeptide repeat protein, partial [Chloroflexota bacterium]|nr:tetratricopeptide repeat protein [Chloroflexota bacterium]
PNTAASPAPWGRIVTILRWNDGTLGRRLALFATVLFVVAVASSIHAWTRGSDATYMPSVATQRETIREQLAALEQRVAGQPGDLDGLTQLASSYLQRARETGDPSFYTLASTAVQRALDADPNSVPTLVVFGSLALSRHDFAGALAIGLHARSLAPDVVATYGVITDANVELGRYDDAIASAQQLADAHPDLAAYSRISYIRELNGDVDGAIASMQQAIDSSSGVPQDEVWSRELLANLYLTNGNVAAAEIQIQRAALLLPDDPATQEGLARLATIQGDNASAEAHLQQAITQRPLMQYVIELGDLLSSEGRGGAAQQQYALVGAMKQLFAANGVDADMEVALFDADHHINTENAYQTALAAYARRSSIYGADAVAWTAFKAGDLDSAQRYMTLARRLGTQDPRLAYHAGVIEQASGQQAAAVRDLSYALSRSALLSALDAHAIRQMLAAAASAAETAGAIATTH